ncbi:MAG: hypothetical protein HY289_11115 [Planctomycetes bacterium]|nr:hypothetical protein [Planctomycetota bacterium]
MRLTLRTLLSYLDDMLDPAQAKLIGAKVAESEQARDLMERIKQVTRRRRLTTPPTSGPGGIDANTIAEYLDNEVTPEQSGEVEQICLASDVHLAEVAACHQILTLVLGEPALVPPTAKQRMYGLVKGPESIPFRKPSKSANQKDDQDLSSELEPDTDDTLRMGVPPVGANNRNIYLIAGGGVLAACLLVFALWQLLSGTNTPVNPGDPKSPEQIAKGDDKKTNGVDPKVKPPGPKQPDEKLPPPKKVDDTPKKQDEDPPTKGKPAEFKEAVVIPRDPASTKQEAIGAYAQPPIKEPAVLLESLPKSGWTRIGGPKAKVTSGRSLLSLPGSKNVIQLETGVELTLWGNLPELTTDGSVLESRATLHVPVALLDADLTLERGRIIIRNKKDGKEAIVRVRFVDPTQADEKFKEEILDITLPAKDSAVVVDRVGSMDRDEAFYENEKDTRRKGPTAKVIILAYEGSSTVRYGDGRRGLSKSQKQLMLEWTSRGGSLEPPENPTPPRWYEGMPEIKNKDMKLIQDKAVAVHERLANAISDVKPFGVALAELKERVQKSVKDETGPGAKGLKPETTAQWIHAIRCSMAVDDVANVYDDFSQDQVPLGIRWVYMQSLQQWLTWDRERDYELFRAVRRYHSNKSTLAVKIMELFHNVSTEDAARLDVKLHLADNLNSDVMSIRTLSHWHLINIVPGAEIFYDPDMPRERRLIAVRQWTDLITLGPKKKDKK